MMKWLHNLLNDPTDPVKHCDLYKDKAAGSCAHVDGPLCDFPGCSMLRNYREGTTIAPTYYVRHPDDSYSVADPQPVPPGTPGLHTEQPKEQQ